jgi:hypothetical protein
LSIQGRHRVSKPTKASVVSGAPDPLPGFTGANGS